MECTYLLRIYSMTPETALLRTPTESGKMVQQHPKKRKERKQKEGKEKEMWPSRERETLRTRKFCHCRQMPETFPSFGQSNGDTCHSGLAPVCQGTTLIRGRERSKERRPGPTLAEETFSFGQILKSGQLFRLGSSIRGPPTAPRLPNFEVTTQEAACCLGLVDPSNSPLISRFADVAGALPESQFLFGVAPKCSLARDRCDGRTGGFDTSFDKPGAAANGQLAQSHIPPWCH